MAFDDIYRPFLDSGRRLVRDSLSGARANPGAMVGVPNPQRDDPYPRFDVLAARKRDRGAAQFAAEEGYEPRTPEELEVASGVDRRIPDAPRSWSEPTRIPGLGSYATTPDGGYAIAHGTPPPVRDIAPRVPFADAAGESFADTVRRGAQARALAEREGLTTADMDYIRTYGRKAWEDRNAKYGAPSSREDYLRRQQGNLAVSAAERQAAGRELADIERENAERRRREEWALAQAAQTDRARIAASVPVSFGAGAGAVQNAAGGWDVSRPPEAPRPRNVQRRGDGSLVDGDTGEVISENPQPEGPDAIPLGGGGMGVKDPATGEWTIKEPTQKSDPVQTGRFRFEENGITDTATGTRTELPPRDRKVVLQEMIDRATQQIIAKGDDAYGSGAKQIEILKAELRALSGEPDPTPAEAAEVKKKGWWGRLFSKSEEPPAPGGASSPSEPQPAPAAEEKPKKKAPKGYHYNTQGELEID